MACEQAPRNLALVALDLSDEGVGVVQRIERGIALFEKALQLAESRQARGAPGERKQRRHPAHPQRAGESGTDLGDEADLATPQLRPSGRHVGVCIECGVELPTPWRQRVQRVAHVQVECVAQGAELERVGNRLEQRLGQQAAHDRQRAGDVGIAPGEVPITVDVLEKEFRRRPPAGIVERVRKARREPRCLPPAEFGDPARIIARLVVRVVQTLMPVQAVAEPSMEIGSTHARIFEARRLVFNRTAFQADAA